MKILEFCLTMIFLPNVMPTIYAMYPVQMQKLGQRVLTRIKKWTKKWMDNDDDINHPKNKAM